MNWNFFFGFFAIATLQLSIINPIFAQSWTQHILPGTAKNLVFNAVACSADGNQIVAAGGGSTFAGTILISSDFGNTWQVTSAPNVYWLSVASSADGKRLVAGASDTNWGIYVSSDSGTNWTGRLPAPIYSVACSTNGLNMVAVKYAGNGPYAASIYLSADGGNTWNPSPSPATTNSFSAVASSADGNKLVAVGGGFNKTYLYTSADAGQSWVLSPAPSVYWTAVASSADGIKLVAVGLSPEAVYTSLDAGATWTLQAAAPPEEWGSVASSYDGKRLVAAGGFVFGQIYTSTDGGVNWFSTNNAPLGLGSGHKPVGWDGVASSADGLRLVGAPAGGEGIYTLEWQPLSATVTATPERIHTGEQIQVVMTTTNLDTNTLTNVQISGQMIVKGDAQGLHASQLSGPTPVSVASLAPGATASFTNIYIGTNYGTASFTARATGTSPNGAEFSLFSSSATVRIVPDGDLLIKRDAEPASFYAGHAVFQTVAAPPQVKGNVVLDTNENSIFEVQIRNDDPLPQTFGILAVHGGLDWQRTYSLNGVDITAQLESPSGDSLPMPLPEMAPGDSMTLGITMRATNDTANSSQLVDVFLGLVSNPNVILDTVQAVSHLGGLSLTGTVYCVCNSNAVPGAKITVGTNTFTSDANGGYFWTNVPPDDYTVTVTATNFEDYTNTFTVDASQTIVTNDIYLTNATFIINPILDPSITSSPDWENISNSISAAAQVYSRDIADPICVQILFFAEEIPGVLGTSRTGRGAISYSQYWADLHGSTNLSATDLTALSTLPAPPNTGIQSNTVVWLTAANLEAIGEYALADGLKAQYGGLNSQISFNFSRLNTTRPGQDPTLNDLQGTAEHEIDEVLGIGGGGSALNNILKGFTGVTDGVNSLDLYRYSAPGVRSFTTALDVNCYFSIDAGRTPLVYFNHNGSGDFGDWGNSHGGSANIPPQVQDAAGTAGTQSDLGSNELIALDIVGYTLLGATGGPRFSFSSDTFNFILGTAPGQTYQVQSTPSLSQQSWQDIGTPFVATSTISVLMDTNATASQKFYRLKAAQPMIIRPLRRQRPQAAGGALPAIPFRTMESTSRILSPSQ